MWFGNCNRIPNTNRRCQYRQIMILTPLLIIEKRFNRFYLLYKFLWRGPVQVRRLLCLRAVIRWYNFCYIARPPPLQPEARCFFWAFPFFIIPNSFAAADTAFIHFPARVRFGMTFLYFGSKCNGQQQSRTF